MTIFPYVYPDLEDQDFDTMAAVVVGFFMSIMLLSMIVSSAFVTTWIIMNKTKQPIFANNDGAVLQGQSNEDLRQLWTQGAQPHQNKGKLQQELAQNEAVKALDDKGPKIDQKGGLESVGSQTENDSEDSESDSESQSEASQSESGNPELYGQERNITGAEVNLMETGFSTGMSKLREAQIQQYREKEKQMF